MAVPSTNYEVSCELRDAIHGVENAVHYLVSDVRRLADMRPDKREYFAGLAMAKLLEFYVTQNDEENTPTIEQATLIARASWAMANIMLSTMPEEEINLEQEGN